MKQIDDIEQDEYLIVDVILLIVSNTTFDTIEKLRFILLNCGIFIQQPLLIEVIEYMKENELIK